MAEWPPAGLWLFVGSLRLDALSIERRRGIVKRALRTEQMGQRQTVRSVQTRAGVGRTCGRRK